MPRNARHQSTQDQRRHNHPDEPQKKISLKTLHWTATPGASTPSSTPARHRNKKSRPSAERRAHTASSTTPRHAPTAAAPTHAIHAQCRPQARTSSRQPHPPRAPVSNASPIGLTILFAPRRRMPHPGGHVASLLDRSNATVTTICATGLPACLASFGRPAPCYPQSMPHISHLECSRCHRHTSAETPQTLCPPLRPARLYVRYDLSSAKGTAVRDRIATEASTAPLRRPCGAYRRRSPLRRARHPSARGWTPMLRRQT